MKIGVDTECTGCKYGINCC